MYTELCLAFIVAGVISPLEEKTVSVTVSSRVKVPQAAQESCLASVSTPVKWEQQCFHYKVGGLDWNNKAAQKLKAQVAQGKSPEHLVSPLLDCQLHTGSTPCSI